MGFGGSVQAMISTIRNNARPKKTAFRTRKEVNDIFHLKSRHLVCKTIPTPDLERIKNDIRIKAKKESKRQRLLAVLIISPILITIFLMVSYQIDQYPENKRLEDRKYEKMISTENKLHFRRW